ncbi:MAG: phosphoribosyltransferase family protein [Bacteroidota bacterium]
MGLTTLLNHEEIHQKISRMTYEIIERNINFKKVVFIGIGENGSSLAKLISNEFKLHSKQETELGEIHLNVSNFNLSPEFKLKNKDGLNKASVILIDDVMNSGQTIMWASSYLIQSGVKQLSTAVLIERKHRTFPIKADIVGLKLSTTLQEHVSVNLKSESHVVSMK